jgi:hypothetical protein
MEEISMIRQLSLILGSTALVAMLSLPAAAQEYSTGNGYLNARGRGPATQTPVEAFGVHPPGSDAAYSRRCVFCWWRKTCIPYYAPLSPTATSVRWEPWCYFPLMPYFTPYYIGYLPHRLCQPKPAPYGSDGGWGDGPMPDHPMPLNPGETPLRYGPYSSVVQDDTIFWNMGGNGLVPYGTPRPPHIGSPDLVDAIQTNRAQGGGTCPPPPDGAPVTTVPAILPPTEKATVKEGDKEAPPQ